MLLKPEHAELYLTDCRTRLPFRFGIATLTRAPLLTLRLEAVLEDGARAIGHSADLLVPRWFRKDPARSVEQDVRELVESAQLAVAAATSADAPPATVFEHWRRVWTRRVGRAEPDAPDRLVRGFGVALVERALMDAACRAAGRSFFQALKQDLFGFRPGEALPELEGWDLAASLPAAPLESLTLRHTVGLADPLRADELQADERLDDGLPQALDEDVARWGLKAFKVKLCGRLDADLDRLLAVARVLDEHVDGRARLTLDGNEQFESLGDLVALLRALEAREEGARLLEGLLYIEQPLARAQSFDPERNAELPALAEYAPLILDEADSGLDTFLHALALGWRGVSVKNCKGVFRALLQRGICEQHGEGAFQSAEDLTNLPVVALQQDLCTVAALGLEHVERNGHHYFHGLDHLPPAEVADALRAHPDLYEPFDGGARLRIEGGRLALGSLQRAGYGYDLEVRTAERTPLARWDLPGRP